MNRLQFQYRIDIRMDAPVQAHHFTLRCIPCESGGQSVERMTLNIAPHDFLAHGRDQWGNATIYGACRNPHTEFHAEVSGIVKTGLSSPIPKTDDASVLPFRYETSLTKADEQLSIFAEKIASNISAPHDYAMRLMHVLHREMTYTPGSTQTSTTAAEAFACRKGVCQDYAHIMLAALRYRRIPSRYVVGIIPGEGESHAWVEVWFDGAWYAFDPTNDTCNIERYIKFSHGRDYRDCEINRGVFRGFCNQWTKVYASVTDAGGEND